MAVFQFDVSFQRSILRLMMLDDVFCMRALEHCEAGFFTTEPMGWVFRLHESYWKEYSRTCSDVPLRDAIRHARPEKQPLYFGEIEAVIATNVIPHAEYVKDELADFCKRNLFALAHQESARLFKAGNAKEAYEITASAQDDINRIEFGTVDRQWFFEELPDRQRKRYLDGMHTAAMATGIEELDRLCGGGVQPGELWAVLAYAKRCKTTWLCNQGFNAIRMYAAPVLHVILEGHGSQIAAKYDALFGDELYVAVKRGEIDPIKHAAMQTEYLQRKKLMVIRTLNDWDINILHVKSELDEVKSYGFKPRLLILDYVDLMRSRYKAESETAHQVAASRDLKRLVNVEEIAAWTAWQAIRPKDNAHTREHVLSSGSVADAYAKVRIVDAFGSLNATNDEMDRGEMRVFWENHRDAPVTKTWVITNDLSKQRMITSVIAADDRAKAEA